jgi:hypothetical protein
MSDDQPTGTIVWKDLTVEKADVIRDFYAEVVGWKHEAVGMGGYDDYNMAPPGGGEWLLYVNVEDIDSSIRRAVELGGHLIDGPRKMGKNRFCVIRDPADAVMALISE